MPKIPQRVGVISNLLFMKKACLLLCAIALLASCSTIHQSATINVPVSYVNTATVADLEVSSKRITYTFLPSKEVRRGGDRNVLQTAIRSALRENGDADVLVDMEYVTKNRPSLSGISSIRMITVTGYPATYKNFHNLGDSIWEKTPLKTSNLHK